ncbi:MAG: amidohydrolase/deacetylase family metallohydrolase [Acidobacteria bacterium]|nr:amidohydrolase/deacetylase family metallohydrolase [Acidobacteriota bacterium]MCI0621140.1 amidohydrolase/deacetylase family metallohydrolase [Acidobacteriota bacterium]MCI0719127.1 amidohydrolase/deacetylase family metallohydrolase [Acidobacteriota bacterium]
MPIANLIPLVCRRSLQRIAFILPLVLVTASVARAQSYDILLQGGHVIDPANRIDQVMDVAISGDRIVRVAPSLPVRRAKKVLNVKGLYVTPGLIDLHAHVYGYSGSVFPDDTALLAGTTTVVDAGGAGWRSFDDFRKRIIEPSRTRVLVFLNIVGRGMIGPEAENNVEDMDPVKTAAKIEENPNEIVGIKVAHFVLPGWTALERAIEAGRLSNTPVIVDDSIFTNRARTSREKLLRVMRPGDLHTHVYNDRQLEVVDRFTGELQPYILEARKRGVLFDLGHGRGSFLWPVAVRAMKQGFPPDTISTDLHSSSIMIQQSDMANCISKLMNLGMKLPDAVERSTVNPARAIKRFPELGTLGEGQVADVAVFELKTGVFAFKDAWSKKLLGTQKLECVATIRNGRLVADLNGLGFPLWNKAGEYEVIP